MERNNRDYQLDLNNRNSRVSFQEHNERMRGFRRSHANLAMVNIPRRNEPALVESEWPLQASSTMVETGGSRLLDDTMDWSAFVPIFKVAQYKLSQN